ncbi:hypothetical protein [Microbacterium sp. YJN-G]|uniref:hypothetical protein n=1 Tax=Microbacterium sp. YJN-G TaxID=2763257 RepID=UPI001878D821|nr:hypothetical protein [Microbacterium sp. YJN-G]
MADGVVLGGALVGDASGAGEHDVNAKTASVAATMLMERMTQGYRSAISCADG